MKAEGRRLNGKAQRDLKEEGRKGVVIILIVIVIVILIEKDHGSRIQQ